MYTVSVRLNTKDQNAVADFLSGIMIHAEDIGLTVDTATMHKELSLIEKIQTVDALIKEIAEEVDKIEASQQKGEDNGENP